MRPHKLKAVPVVLFEGKEYLFLTDDGLSGPLATPDNYRHCETPYAHVYADGTIIRYGKHLGWRDELRELRKERPPEPTEQARRLAEAKAFGMMFEGMDIL